MTTVGACHSCEEAGAGQGVASKVMVAWGVKDRVYSVWKLKPRFDSFFESLGNTCTIKRDEEVMVKEVLMLNAQSVGQWP